MRCGCGMAPARYKKAVLDFSGFVGPNGDLVIKELAIVDIASGASQHWIFKCPTDDTNEITDFDTCLAWETRYRWIGRYFHGLDYYDGSSEYKSLDKVLHMCDEFRLLYAATREKARALEKLFNYSRAVFSLQSLGCDVVTCCDTMALTCPDWCKDGEAEDKAGTAGEPDGTCLYHRLHAPTFNCAAREARKLAKWCKDNVHRIDMNIVDNRQRTFDADWNKTHPTARELAEKGFVRVHCQEDSVKCVYCGLVLYRWMDGDIVEEDHQFNSSRCMFLIHQRQLADQLEKVLTDDCKPRADDVTGINSELITDYDLFTGCHA